MTCLDDATVLGLLEGRIAAPALALVDDHLDTCASCRDVVAQVARIAAPSSVLERGLCVGRYVIGELVGAGAMGRVYSAWEPELDRRVALKLLVAEGDDARDRVVREAKVMARLDHPNVVGVHEVGVAPEGVYVAMDLVDGDSLRAWASTPRPWRETLARLVEVARGLAAVHVAGVVHRDIKPDNIIVGADQRARLGDFGLARAGATGTGAASAPPAALGSQGRTAERAIALGTPSTAIAGTPAYMAPEVLRGEPATAASDQFGFGVMAYEVLAGRRPFGGATWAELLEASSQTAPPIREIPSWLDAAVRRCLAPDPNRRFGSMTDVADHLVARAGRRVPIGWIAGATLAAAIGSVATWYAVRTPAAAPGCELGAAELRPIWGPTARARLTALDPHALASLDTWATRWAAERDGTCRAATTRPALEIAARTRCLDQRRAELGALVERISTDPTVGGRIADALAALPSPTECRAAARGAADPLPLDPTRAGQVGEVLAGLPAVRAASALGDARPVVAEAARLVALATASDHAPTLAEALLVQVEVLRGASQLVEAQWAALDAVGAATRGHDDLLAARAWVARVAAAGGRRQLASAEEYGAIAAAAIDRAGAPPHLAATLLRLRGLVAYNRGEYPTATALLTEAHQLFTQLTGARSIEVTAVESALGSVARAARDLDAAERWHRSALAIDRQLHGPQHPTVARDLHNIAGVLRLRDQLDDAAATYEQALAIELATGGPTSAEAGLTRNSLGLVHMARGDWAAARASLELARDALTAAAHGERAFTHHNLGLVAAAQADHAAAVREYTAADDAYQATIGRDAPPVVRLELDRARSELALGLAAGRTRALDARDRATRAGIAWIAEDAEALLLLAAARGAPPAARPARAPTPVVATEVRIEPSPDPGPATPPQPAETGLPPRAPAAPPAPAKRDVGVYGSTQPW